MNATVAKWIRPLLLWIGDRVDTVIEGLEHGIIALSKHNLLRVLEEISQCMCLQLEGGPNFAYLCLSMRESRGIPPAVSMAQPGIKHTDCTFMLPLYETETIMSDSSWRGSLCWAFLAAVQPVVLIGPTANNIDDRLAEYAGLLPFLGASGHRQQGGNVHVSVQVRQIEEQMMFCV